MTSWPLSHTLGVPRIGPRRELKTALEAHWRGELTEAALLEVGRTLRVSAWRRQQTAGIDLPASNDFSFYDHVLDAACLVGCVPRRFDRDEGTISLATTFAQARGSGAPGGQPLEMTKWFDTNYHHLVPEVGPETRFRLASQKPFVEYREARAVGIATKPILLGPLTFLALAKPVPEAAAGWDRLALLPPLLAVYAQILERLAALGATWVELDEPALALDLEPDFRAAYGRAYASLRAAAPRLRLLVATYFGPLGQNLETVLGLPVAGLHVDAVRAPQDLAVLAERLARGRVLSVGAIDGRNIWRADLARAWATLERARGALGSEHVLVAPSCSLLHVPWSLAQETHLPRQLRERLAFAEDKLAEVATLARALRGDPVSAAVEAAGRATHPAPPAPTAAADRLVDLASAGDPSGALVRHHRYPVRQKVQQEALRLPPLPTTTIGSLPQTKNIRVARARFRQGDIDQAAYRTTLEAETARAIALQESIGLDVPVHGEFERTDMVEFFADKLAGFALTSNGWVQSYGSRCTRPPIVYGPIARRGPMTTDFWSFAQGLTSRPVKGMLTGPVTILKWSFARDDQPLALTCAQIARAIREEAVDLERAGARIIQIDEPGLREGLPLAATARPAYLAWAVACFRMAAGGVSPVTQIHSHMCYAELGEIFAAVVDLDADVLSIEASRSDPAALDAFVSAPYPNELGPGVWDIHAPQIPGPRQMAERLSRTEAAGFPRRRLWLNPDCGLKTRDWVEVEPGLRHLVTAARDLRAGSNPYI